MKKSEPTRWLRRSAAFIMVALLLIVGAACTSSGLFEHEMKALDELGLSLGDLGTIGQIGPDGLTPEQQALLEKLQFQPQQIDTMDQLLTIVKGVGAGANDVAYGSQQLSASAQEMSQGTNEQAATSEQATSSMEEMSASINQNADNAMNAEKIALKSAQDEFGLSCCSEPELVRSFAID